MIGLRTAARAASTIADRDVMMERVPSMDIFFTTEEGTLEGLVTIPPGVPYRRVEGELLNRTCSVSELDIDSCSGCALGQH